MPGHYISTASLWRLTGRRRARAIWFGLVVLDVEEVRTHSFVPKPSDYNGEKDSYETRWRRARWRDVAKDLPTLS